MRPELAAFWSFIAAAAAGVADDSRRTLADHARGSDDESFRRTAQRHLAAAPSVSPPTLSANSTAIIGEIESALGRPTR